MHEHKQTETKLTHQQLESAILLQTRFNDLLGALNMLEVPTEGMRNRIQILLMQKLEDRKAINVADLEPLYQLFAGEEQRNEFIWDLNSHNQNTPEQQEADEAFHLDEFDYFGGCGGAGVMD